MASGSGLRIGTFRDAAGAAQWDVVTAGQNRVLCIDHAGTHTVEVIMPAGLAPSVATSSGDYLLLHDHNSPTCAVARIPAGDDHHGWQQHTLNLRDHAPGCVGVVCVTAAGESTFVLQLFLTGNTPQPHVLTYDAATRQAVPWHWLPAAGHVAMWPLRVSDEWWVAWSRPHADAASVEGAASMELGAASTTARADGGGAASAPMASAALALVHAGTGRAFPVLRAQPLPGTISVRTARPNTGAADDTGLLVAYVEQERGLVVTEARATASECRVVREASWALWHEHAAQRLEPQCHQETVLLGCRWLPAVRETTETKSEGDNAQPQVPREQRVLLEVHLVTAVQERLAVEYCMPSTSVASGTLEPVGLVRFEPQGAAVAVDTAAVRMSHFMHAVQAGEGYKMHMMCTNKAFQTTLTHAANNPCSARWPLRKYVWSARGGMRGTAGGHAPFLAWLLWEAGRSERLDRTIANFLDNSGIATWKLTRTIAEGVWEAAGFITAGLGPAYAEAQPQPQPQPVTLRLTYAMIAIDAGAPHCLAVLLKRGASINAASQYRGDAIAAVDRGSREEGEEEKEMVEHGREPAAMCPGAVHVTPLQRAKDAYLAAREDPLGPPLWAETIVVHALQGRCECLQRVLGDRYKLSPKGV